mgnify:CR=1 FL=1
MSKWNKWKLTHKETGLSFNEYRRQLPLCAKDGNRIYKEYLADLHNNEVIPVMLTSGILAVYVGIEHYPYMFYLDNKEWSVTMIPASPKPTTYKCGCCDGSGEYGKSVCPACSGSGESGT